MVHRRETRLNQYDIGCDAADEDLTDEALDRYSATVCGKVSAYCTSRV